MRPVSALRTGSAEFRRNRAAMQARVAELRAIEARAAAASEARRPVFAARGQITPRERLARLLDPGLPFLRLMSLAGWLCDRPDPAVSVPGASVILGIGFVAGTRCLVWVDDSGIRAGALGPMALPAILAAQEIALRQKLPLVHLVESAGADLSEYQVELWARGGAIFHNLARLSAAGIPTVTVLHGPSTAGGAYMPGLSDHVIGVRGNGIAALAGAALVAAATGEQASDAELGGAEMHATVSGLVEHLAEDDIHAVALARAVVRGLAWDRAARARPGGFAEPLHPPEEIEGLVPEDPRMPWDVTELVLRLADGSEIEPFKPGFGAATPCFRARIHGHAVGILGNNGPIDPDGAAKATQFLQLCDQAGHAAVFLQNTTGYIVGTASERAGMIKHGAKMIQAVTNIRVPRLTLYVGASYGAGNYGMCGIGAGPDFLFAWPNARTGVMGGAEAARTMTLVARAAAARRGEVPDEAALAARAAAIRDRFEAQASALHGSARVLDHGVIDPRDSRRVLGFCLDTVAEARARMLRPNAFGVARI